MLEVLSCPDIFLWVGFVCLLLALIFSLVGFRAYHLKSSSVIKDKKEVSTLEGEIQSSLEGVGLIQEASEEIPQDGERATSEGVGLIQEASEEILQDGEKATSPDLPKIPESETKKSEEKTIQLKSFLQELNKELLVPFDFSQIDERDVVNIRDVADKIQKESSERQSRCEGVLRDIKIESNRLYIQILGKKLETSEEILDEMKDFQMLSEMKMLSESERVEVSTSVRLEYILEELEKELGGSIDFLELDDLKICRIQNVLAKLLLETSERRKRCGGVLKEVHNECKRLYLKTVKDRLSSEKILEELQKFSRLNELKKLCALKLRQQEECEGSGLKLENILGELKKNLPAPLDFSKINYNTLLDIQNIATDVSQSSERRAFCGDSVVFLRNECRSLREKIREKSLTTSEEILKEMQCLTTLSALKNLMELDEVDRGLLKQKKISVEALQKLKDEILKEIEDLRAERLKSQQKLEKPKQEKFRIFKFKKIKFGKLKTEPYKLEELEDFASKDLKTLNLEQLRALKAREIEQAKVLRFVSGEEKVEASDEDKKELNELQTAFDNLKSSSSLKKERDKLGELRARALRFMLKVRREGKTCETDARKLYDEISKL